MQPSTSPLPSQLLCERRIVDLPAGDRVAGLRMMWEAACDDPLIVDPDGLWAALMDREGQASTAIGQGIAIPHAKHAASEGLLLTIGRAAPGGLDYTPPDGVPVRLILMLIASDKQTREFIRVLARLSALLQQEPIARGLLELPPAEVIALLQAHE